MNRAMGLLKDPFADMNRTERRYAAYLEGERMAKRVLWWRWNPGSLKLTIHQGKTSHYRPDFLVQVEGGEIQIHETKGFMRDDADLKIRMVADQFPFRVLVVYLHDGTWTWVDYSEPSNKENE